MRTRTSTKRKREIEAARLRDGIQHPPEGVAAARAMLAEGIAAAQEQSRSAGASLDAEGDAALREMGREPGDSAHVGEKTARMMERMVTPR